VAPTSRLTDANNTEQLQLAFQQKVVEVFHSCHAQEAEDISTIQMVPVPSSDNVTPTITPPKRNLSTVTNKDGDSDKHVEDEDSDDQPKLCKSLVFTSQTVHWNCFAAKKQHVAPNTANVTKNKSTATIVTDDDIDGGGEADRESNPLKCMYFVQ
jgi:hypothetical protein